MKLKPLPLSHPDMSGWNNQTLTPPSPPHQSLPRTGCGVRGRLWKGEGVSAGITLIEVLISLAVITIGILGLFSAFPLAGRAQKVLKDEETAQLLAQAKIEELSGAAYENLPAGTVEDRARLATSTDDYFYNFTRATQISLLDQDMNATTTDVGLKKITSTVFWPAGISGERAASLVYLKSER